jgi:hypothetical protein
MKAFRLVVIAVVLGSANSSSCFAGLTIVNAGFEAPNLGSGFAYDPTGPGVGWTFSSSYPSAGIAANGSGFGVGGPGTGQSGSGTLAPEGMQVGFLQAGGSSISQSLSGFTIGDSYVFTFLAAQRPTSTTYGLNEFTQTIEVYLDATLLGTFTPGGSGSYTSFTTSAITINDDLPHILTFDGTNADYIAAGEPAGKADNTAFIDAVSYSVVVPEPSSLVLGLTASLLAAAAGCRRLGSWAREASSPTSVTVVPLTPRSAHPPSDARLGLQ